MTKDPELADAMFLVDVPQSDGGASTLSFSRSPTVALNFAANRFTRSAARLYQREFGIGAMDWRMLVMLTRAPGCNVAEASETIGIDKAAVSRSLARLEGAGLAEAVVNRPDARRREWSLTPKGKDLHDRILKVALARQKRLLQGFSVAEVEQFNDFLARFLDNLEAMNEEDES